MEPAAHGHSTLGIPEKVGKEFVAADAEHKIAAGIVFVAPDGDVLLLKRAKSEANYPGHWSLPGGKADEGETAPQAARREAKEEIGDHPDGDLRQIDQRITPTGMQFHTFRQDVESKFTPTLNGEHSEHVWAARDKLPKPLHPAVKDVLGTRMAGDTRLKTKIDAGIAFDRASVRSIDADGRMHIAVSNISKANVCPYLGREIPDFDNLGLDPDHIYQLYRDPDELKKAAASFNNIPLLIKHTPVSADAPQLDQVVGTVGSEADFVAPYLRNSLAVWTREAIDLIESEKQKELSCAYRYRADMTPGHTPAGEAYDGVMRDLIGNHVAIVPEGRAGPAVVVGDAALSPSIQEVFQMSKLLSRKAALTHGAMMIYLLPKLAKDAKLDLAPVFAGVTGKNFKEKKVVIVKGITDATRGKLAKDASIEDVAKLLDSLDGVEVAEAKDEETVVDPADTGGMDADPVEGLRKYLGECGMDAESVEKACSMMKPKATDESPEEKEAREKKEKAEAEKKTAADAEKDVKEMVSKPAMDAAIKLASDKATKAAEAATMKRLNDIRIAERAVEPLIGKPAVALDSAEAIYAAALKAGGVKTEGVDPSAFPAMIDLLITTKANSARPQHHHQAQDAGLVTERADFEKAHGIAPRKIRVLG
jgi:8-oxo-dGTP pyrophosphatase MutT (NUDIX family)